MKPMDIDVQVEETRDPPMHVEQVHVTFHLDENTSTWIDANRTFGAIKPGSMPQYSPHDDMNQPLPIKVVQYDQLPLMHILLEPARR